MAEPPEAMTGTPDPAIAAREIIAALRVSGAVFLEAEFTAPWCILSQVGPEDCVPFTPVPRHIIAYHCVTEGGFFVALDGAEPVAVAAGQIVILPRNDPHLMGSAPGLRPVSSHGLIQPGAAGGLARITHGGGGATTRLSAAISAATWRTRRPSRCCPAYCGSRPTMRPAGSRARSASPRPARGRRRRARHPGAARRAPVRRGHPAPRRAGDRRGWRRGAWTAGLGDPVVRRALACMHDDLARRWTTDELAARCNLSRSAFADRFTRTVGEPPSRYVSRVRLERARAMLEDTTDSLARIAFAVGYESEAAFSRAFRREHGAPPAAWRRDRGGPARRV